VAQPFPLISISTGDVCNEEAATKELHQRRFTLIKLHFKAQVEGHVADLSGANHGTCAAEE
jgi:hypothetical protein